MDAGHRGATALNNKDFTLAISEFTNAITASPTSPLYYIQRSTAHQKLHQYQPALADASRAVIYAHQRQKRELIAQAQLRRAIPLFFLGRYGDAGKCLEWSERGFGQGKEKMIGVWRSQVSGKMKVLEEGDEKLVVRVKEVPLLEEVEGGAGGNTNSDTAPATDGTNGVEAQVAGSTNRTQMQPTTASTQPSQRPISTTTQTTPANKIRHDWYQTSSTITLTILVKNAPKDTTSITIQPTSISISIPITSSSTYELTLDPLYAAITPEQSSYRILGTKIEVTLDKAEKGIKWHALEASEPTTADTNDTPAGDSARSAKSVVADPYTHKAGKKVVNWDAIGRKPPKPSQESSKGKREGSADVNENAANGEKPRIEEVDDAVNGSPSHTTDSTTSMSASPTTTTTSTSTNTTTTPAPAPNPDQEDTYYSSDEESSSSDPNYFFKKLFAGADDNVKKAMMKSYQESGGTALSTNWEEVSKGRVPVEPPEGMVAREWEGARSRGRRG